MSDIMRLPTLGEDINTGVLVAITAQVGDTLNEGQILFEIETDKVVVEVPARCNGTLKKILVQTNTTVSTGDALAEIECDSSTASIAVPNTKLSQKTGPKQSTQVSAPLNPLPLRSQVPAPLTAKTTASVAPAGPASRNLARKLGIDIRQVHGNGKNGRISKHDVIAHAKQLITTVNNTQNNRGQALPDDSRFGPIQRAQANSIQLATASNMHTAWRQIPHAWLQAEIDITALQTQRKNSREKPASLNAFIVKAIAVAMQQLPLFNAVWDAVTEEIAYRHYIDINIAVDTPKGLLVPVIRKVNQKDVATIGEEIDKLAQAARNNRISRDEMSGGGITLSNLGGFGLSSIQPIVNWPQAAIVGIASAQWQQHRDGGGQWREALFLPLTLGFDHRIINGADGARFIGVMRDYLENAAF